VTVADGAMFRCVGCSFVAGRRKRCGLVRVMTAAGFINWMSNWTCAKSQITYIDCGCAGVESRASAATLKGNSTDQVACTDTLIKLIQKFKCFLSKMWRTIHLPVLALPPPLRSRHLPRANTEHALGLGPVGQRGRPAIGQMSITSMMSGRT
jgi:hypothetical protein